MTAHPPRGREVLFGAFSACIGLILIARCHGHGGMWLGMLLLLAGVTTFVSILRRAR